MQNCDAIKPSRSLMTIKDIRSFIRLLNVNHGFVLSFVWVYTLLSRNFRALQLRDNDRFWLCIFWGVKAKVGIATYSSATQEKLKLGNGHCCMWCWSEQYSATRPKGGRLSPSDIRKKNSDQTGTRVQYHQKNVLAIVCYILLLRTYLEGQQLTIRTEHVYLM